MIRNEETEKVRRLLAECASREQDNDVVYANQRDIITGKGVEDLIRKARLKNKSDRIEDVDCDAGPFDNGERAICRVVFANGAGGTYRRDRDRDQGRNGHSRVSMMSSARFVVPGVSRAASAALRPRSTGARPGRSETHAHPSLRDAVQSAAAGASGAAGLLVGAER